MRYDDHLCAQDPTRFEAGFNASRRWIASGHLSPGYVEDIYRAMRDSTDVPFPETAAKVGLVPLPYTEGFMLGVYGHVALSRLGGFL